MAKLATPHVYSMPYVHNPIENCGDDYGECFSCFIVSVIRLGDCIGWMIVVFVAVVFKLWWRLLEDGRTRLPLRILYRQVGEESLGDMCGA